MRRHTYYKNYDSLQTEYQTGPPNITNLCFYRKIHVILRVKTDRNIAVLLRGYNVFGKISIGSKLLRFRLGMLLLSTQLEKK